MNINIMSEEIVNQLNLFLINKNQFQQLDKITRNITENKRKTDKKFYESRISKLFNELLVDNEDSELLFECVKNEFDIFIDKCIYYFKIIDANEFLEKERNNEDYLSDNLICDGIDLETEEQETENGNYKEGSEDEDSQDNEDSESDDHTESPKDTNKIHRLIEQNSPVIVKHKYKQKTNSIGVDNIQTLPLDWFQNVRENYAKNKIISKRKDKCV
jgi:hypothetical protein